MAGAYLAKWLVDTGSGEELHLRGFAVGDLFRPLSVGDPAREIITHPDERAPWVLTGFESRPLR